MSSTNSNSIEHDSSSIEKKKCTCISRPNKICSSDRHECICNMIKPESCRASIHACCCGNYDPSLCKAKNKKHRCSCGIVLPEKCRAILEKHICFEKNHHEKIICRASYHNKDKQHKYNNY